MHAESSLPPHAIISSLITFRRDISPPFSENSLPVGIVLKLCGKSRVCMVFSSLGWASVKSPPSTQASCYTIPFFFLPSLSAKPAHSNANRALLWPSGMALSKGSGLCSLNWERSLVLCLFSRFCPWFRCRGYSVWGGRFPSVSPCNLLVKPRCIWG